MVRRRDIHGRPQARRRHCGHTRARHPLRAGQERVANPGRKRGEGPGGRRACQKGRGRAADGIVQARATARSTWPTTWTCIPTTWTTPTWAAPLSSSIWGHALSAIATGRINCAVITYSAMTRSGGLSMGTGSAEWTQAGLAPSPDSFEYLYGITTVGLYALIAQRHMHQYGTKPEHLAEVSVAVRKHASMNPQALFRNPITVEDVVNSRIISSPLHLLDCCVITDGGGRGGGGIAGGCPQLPPASRLGPGRGRSGGPPGRRKARPGLHRGQAEPRPRVRHGRGYPRRRRHGHDLRLLHHHGAGIAGRPGLLREGRGRRLRLRRPAADRRRAAHQHRRRRPVFPTTPA